MCARTNADEASCVVGASIGQARVAPLRARFSDARCSIGREFGWPDDCVAQFDRTCFPGSMGWMRQV